MSETRAVHDPFLGKDVEISNKLVDRLRGKYANGPTMPNGEPEFGWREFPTPPIQHEAAKEIERLTADLAFCCAERDAADEVSRTARLLVEPLKQRLDITVILTRPLTCEAATPADRKAALDWFESMEAVKS